MASTVERSIALARHTLGKLFLVTLPGEWAPFSSYLQVTQTLPQKGCKENTNSITYRSINSTYYEHEIKSRFQVLTAAST